MITYQIHILAIKLHNCAALVFVTKTVKIVSLHLDPSICKFSLEQGTVHVI